MATLKWKNDENWETFYYGAFENIKADLRNIITAINNAAAAIRMRCRRDKNLSDLYSASEGRKNLELIGDCSDEAKRLGTTFHHHDAHHLVKAKNLSDVKSVEESRYNLNFQGNDHSKEAGKMGKSWHHHDGEYIPIINALKERINELEKDVENGMGSGMISIKQVWLAGDEYRGTFGGGYYWLGWGLTGRDWDVVIRDFVEPYLMYGVVGQKYEVTFKITATIYASKEDGTSPRTPYGKAIVNSGVKGYENGGDPEDAWKGAGQQKTLNVGQKNKGGGQTKFSFSNTITMYKSSDVVPPLYIGWISPFDAWDGDNGIIYDGGRFDTYITRVVVDGKEAKLGVESDLVPRQTVHIAESEWNPDMHGDGEDGHYYWIGWGVTDHDTVISDFIEPYIVSGAKGQSYEVTFRLRCTIQAKKKEGYTGSNRGQMGAVLLNMGNDWDRVSLKDCYNSSNKKSIGDRTNWEVVKTLTFNKSINYSNNKAWYAMGVIGPENVWSEFNDYQGGRIDLWIEKVKIDGVEEKIGVKKK